MSPNSKKSFGKTFGPGDLKSSSTVSRKKTAGSRAGSKKECEATLDAIETALRAVSQAVKDVQSRHVSQLAMLKDREDCESEAGSSSTGSDVGNWPRPSLRDARRSLKEHVQAEERSVKFTRGLLAKLDSIRETVDV